MTYLYKVALLLDIPLLEKSKMLKELKFQLGLQVEELVRSGMDAAQARSAAEKQLGTPDEVAHRYNSESNVSDWASSIYTALPFFVYCTFMLLPQSNILILFASLLGLAFMWFCIRELRRGNNPVWVSTWFISALLNPSIGFIAPIVALYLAFIERRFRVLIVALLVIQIVSVWFAIPIASESIAVAFVYFSVLPISIIMLAFLVNHFFKFYHYPRGYRFSLCLMTAYVSIGLTMYDLHYLFAVDFALIGFLVMMMIRASTRRMKEKILSLIVIIHSLALSVYLSDWEVFNAVSVVWIIVHLCILAFIANWLIFIPIRSENQINSVIPSEAFEVDRAETLS